MHKVVMKSLTAGLILVFTLSLFLNIVPRKSWAADPFEPNNTTDQVTVLHKGSYAGLSLYQNDYDYYCIFLGVGDNMSVVLWNYTATPNFNVRDPSGDSYVNAFVDGSTEKVLILPVAVAGYYYIVVSGSTTNYNLNITDIESPAEDGFEPNDNFESAQELLVDESYVNLSLWDADYYKISLAESANLSIAMNRTTGSSDYIDVALYAPDNTTVLDSTTLTSPLSSTELSLLNASVGGSYFLKFTSRLGAWGNYCIAIRSLDDDAMEPNDNFTTAAPLTKDIAYTNLRLCDNDYYNITLMAGEDALIVVTRSLGAGIFFLTIYGPDQTPLLATQEMGPCETRDPTLLNVPFSGDYSIKINGTVGARGNYSLRVYPLEDDLFEPNDGFSTAATILKDTPYDDLAFLNEDFYNLTLAAGENLSVTLDMYYGPGSGLFSATLYAPDQSTSLGTVLVYTGDEGLITLLSAPSAGIYYIRVNGSVNAWGNYTLLARAVYDDRFEENDAYSSAVPLAKNAQYDDITLLDDDFFNVTLALGENLSVILAPSSGPCTYNLSLIAPDQVTLLESVTVMPYDYGQVSLAAAASAGTYYIRVTRQDPSVGNYTLLLFNTFDDVFEPNNGPDTAPLLTKGSAYSNLALMDDDYFNLTLTAGDNLSIVVARPYGGSGEFYLHLFSPAGELLVSQTVTYGPPFYFMASAEILLPEVTVPGTYTILVNCSADASGNYSLTLRNLPDDILEPNDAFGSAAPVSKGNQYQNLALLDDDYYAIPLLTGQNVSISLLRTTSMGISGFFNAYLYDTDATSLLKAVDLSTTASGMLVIFAPADGTYFLKVNGTYASNNNYSLSLRDAFDDAFEPNNDVGSAPTLVNGSTYTDLYYLNDDFYNVSLQAGGDFAATLYRAGGGGILYLHLFGPNGDLLCNVSVAASQSKDTFTASVPTTGIYTIKINGSEGAFGHYSLMLGGIQDDTYEQNDDFAHAPALTHGRTYGSLQLYDPDFFSYVAAPGESFRVLLESSSGSSIFFNLTIYAPDQVTVLCAGEYNYMLSSMLYGFSLIVPTAAGGTYYVKVNASAGIHATYSLCVNDVQDDAREENDDQDHALVLNPYMTQMAGVAMDEDWFKISLSADDTVWWYWIAADGASGFTLELLAADGLTSLPLTDFQVTMPVPFTQIVFQYYPTYVAGDFYLRLRPTPGRASLYLLFMLATNVSQPEDFSYYEGTLGNTITWTVQDSYPYSYYTNNATVFRNDTPILTQTWDSEDVLSIDVDGLTPGIYNFTLAVVNWIGVPRNDSVIVQVLHPILTLSSPDNVTFVIGHAPEIQWTVGALHVGTTGYTILCGEAVLEELTSGTWVPGSTINYTPSILGVGTHSLTLNVTDGLGNFTIDVVGVTVLTDLAITRPLDLSFTTGSTGNVLSWTPSATQVGVTFYEIRVNGAVVASDSWIPGTPITYSPDALGPGTFNVTVIVFDGFGTLLQDEVVVTVLPPGGFPLELVLVVAAVAGAVIVSAVLVNRRKKKRMFYP